MGKTLQKRFFCFLPLKSPTTQNLYFLDLSKKWNVNKISNHTCCMNKKICGKFKYHTWVFPQKKFFLSDQLWLLYFKTKPCPFLCPSTVLKNKQKALKLLHWNNKTKQLFLGKTAHAAKGKKHSPFFFLFPVWTRLSFDKQIFWRMWVFCKVFFFWHKKETFFWKRGKKEVDKI